MDSGLAEVAVHHRREETGEPEARKFGEERGVHSGHGRGRKKPARQIPGYQLMILDAGCQRTCGATCGGTWEPLGRLVQMLSSEEWQPGACKGLGMLVGQMFTDLASIMH